MEFSLTCPIDGEIELRLEDITALVFRGPETVDVVFVCPHCGTNLRATFDVPNLMTSAMELVHLMEESASDDEGLMFEIADDVPSSGDGTAEDAPKHPVLPRAIIDRYCEYFHRQLDTVDTVDDVLAEMDSRHTRD